MYYYLKNIQGDIVKIVNKAGKEYVKYEYDAWGKIINQSGETILRDLNPFRYRGYVYDRETGLYYLQSRYYDPVTGRFLNADVYCDTENTILGTNMFAYCENNPTNNADYDGTWCQNSSGFKKTSKGFKVNVATKFLSRTYCLLFAGDFLWNYGKWNWFGKTYSGMGAVRIAQEIWFHALAYYIGKPLQTVLSWYGISNSSLNGIVNSAKVIDVNSDDKRAWIYQIAWYAGGYIKLKLAMKQFGVMKYVVLIIL